MQRCHTAFTAGVLQGLMERLPSDTEVVALSGTSGGAICATLAWDGLVRHDRKLAIQKLREFWDAMAAREPWDRVFNQYLLGMIELRDVGEREGERAAPRLELKAAAKSHFVLYQNLG